MIGAGLSAADIGRTLLGVARAALEHELGGAPTPRRQAAWLQSEGACFVTLRCHGRLRGCIGTLRAHRSLLEDVETNALAAAFRDPRFSPLQADELNDLVIEISLLSPLERLRCADEADLLRQLRPGVDGLLLECGHHRGTFLPAVWRELREPRRFLRHLKLKAGLAEDFWGPELIVRRYTTQSWSEADLPAKPSAAGPR